jgi:hypothetical protein
MRRQHRSLLESITLRRLDFGNFGRTRPEFSERCKGRNLNLTYAAVVIGPCILSQSELNIRLRPVADAMNDGSSLHMHFFGIHIRGDEVSCNILEVYTLITL